MFSFVKSFIGVKGKQLGQDIVQALVEIDPESATQAQLEQMERDLDQAGLVLQKIRADYEREVREADDAEKRYNQMLAAAEHLQRKLDAAETGGAGDRAGLEASLAKLVTQLEDFAPEVEQERQDVVEVQALLDEALAAYKAKAEALTTAKQKLDRARTDMQRAILAQERADEKARRAAEVAGLRQGGTNKLTVAVDAMQRRAEDARSKAEASRLKADTLTRLGQGSAADANIAEAMRAVESGGRVGGLSERLAALKGPSSRALPKA